MAAAIRLTVITGPHKDRKFCFCGPTRCQAGRALDCFIHFGGTQRDQLISRYHCQMEFDPPIVQVRDLGSRNGTFVNGKRLELLIPDPANPGRPGISCQHGDLITLGGTTLRVDVVDCPHAGQDPEPGWDGELTKKDCQQLCEAS
jgi:hypothetical protein